MHKVSDIRHSCLRYSAINYWALAPEAIGVYGNSETALTCPFRSGIIKSWKFVERHTPRQLPDDGLVTEFPDELERDGIGAFLAFWKCLAPQQRDFMGQSMSGVSDLINSTGRNHRARFELPAKHCGRFYQEYRLAMVSHSRTPLSN